PSTISVRGLSAITAPFHNAFGIVLRPSRLRARPLRGGSDAAHAPTEGHLRGTLADGSPPGSDAPEGDRRPADLERAPEVTGRAGAEPARRSQQLVGGEAPAEAPATADAIASRTADSAGQQGSDEPRSAPQAR